MPRFIDLFDKSEFIAYHIYQKTCLDEAGLLLY